MLPNGITGFRDLDHPYVAEQEKKGFQKLCYSIATRYHCMVASFDFDLTGKNFYSAEIKTKQGSLYLLENAYYPWIAFAKNCDYTEIELIESPFDLTEQNIYMLTLSELGQDWHGFVSQLGEAEREQIKYWKPKTIGDIIFNFWD